MKLALRVPLVRRVLQAPRVPSVRRDLPVPPVRPALLAQLGRRVLPVPVAPRSS